MAPCEKSKAPATYATAATAARGAPPRARGGARDGCQSRPAAAPRQTGRTPDRTQRLRILGAVPVLKSYNTTGCHSKYRSVPCRKGSYDIQNPVRYRRTGPKIAPIQPGHRGDIYCLAYVRVHIYGCAYDATLYAIHRARARARRHRPRGQRGPARSSRRLPTALRSARYLRNV